MKPLSQALLKYQQENQTYSLKNASLLKKCSAFIYRMIGRNVVGRLLITSATCQKCKKCVDFCPHQVIEFRLDHPRRTKKCKGCFRCIKACPQQAIEMPIGQVAMAFLLLFLPYDEGIGRLFSLEIHPNSLNIWDLALSLSLWSLGYMVAFVLLDKIAFLLHLCPPVKRLGERPFVKKIRDEINPVSIFPVGTWPGDT